MNGFGPLSVYKTSGPCFESGEGDGLVWVGNPQFGE